MRILVVTVFLCSILGTLDTCFHRKHGPNGEELEDVDSPVQPECARCPDLVNAPSEGFRPADLHVTYDKDANGCRLIKDIVCLPKDNDDELTQLLELVVEKTELEEKFESSFNFTEHAIALNCLPTGSVVEKTELEEKFESSFNFTEHAIALNCLPTGRWLMKTINEEHAEYPDPTFSCISATPEELEQQNK